MSGLSVLRIGPGCTLQDPGRPGCLDLGLSRGGAVDGFALAEGAALLRQDIKLAVLEMAGMGGVFQAQRDLRIALTGAPMEATVDGARLTWNASHWLEAGQQLTIGGARQGVYGYLHVGGGFEGDVFLRSRSTHLTAGIGRLVRAGDVLDVGGDGGRETGLFLPEAARFTGGTVRVVPGFQTALFAPEVLDRFVRTSFTRGPRANRMGVQLLCDGEGFAAHGQLNILSEIIVPGDVQMTGDGRPFVLLPECQTTGGYPRIGTVLPADLPIVAQAPAGAELQFTFVSREEAATVEATARAAMARLRQALKPLVRPVDQMADLLSYQLIGGVVSAHDDLSEDTR